MNKNSKVLSDPLLENVLPLFAQKLNINHWSPTQFALPDGPWLFKYIFLTQEQRRLLLNSNSAMEAGKRVGDTLQKVYADIIYKINPQTNKLTPVKNEKLTLDVALQEQIELYKEYQPNDDKDADKKSKYIDEIRSIVANANDGLNELVVANPVICEKQISISNNNLENFSLHSPILSVVGRTDFEFGGNNQVLGHGLTDFNPTSKDAFSPGSIIELKTKYSRLGKVKKDGTRSFLVSSSPATASFNHVVQCAVYAAAYNFKVPVYLLYATEKDYKIFDSTNCSHLTVQGMQRNIQIMFNTFIRREKLLALFQDQTRSEIIEHCVQMIQGDFEHPYAWSGLPHDLLKEAKELWKVA